MEARDLNQTPPLHRRHVRRPRLTKLLDASTAQSIILIGPAGYGKTSLAAEWLGERENVAWFRATSASADVAAFSAGLCETIAPIVPGAGERVRQRLRIADAPEAAARPLAELVADDLSDWPDGGWLVVDDYQLVATSKAVEDFMDWLLMLAPRLRTLVTSRRRPGWATARRILYGEVAELGPEHLAMTTEEAADVLDARAPESVRALVAQAEGWPAVIGLAALSTSDVLPEERVADDLYRFVADEVFREQPPDVQRLMLAASIPPTFRAADLDIYEGVVEDPVGALNSLVNSGLVAEAHAREFRFHPLLQDFLRRHILTSDADRARTFAHRFLERAEKERRWIEAFDIAYRHGEVKAGAAIVGRAAPDLLASGQVETLERWLQLCGSEVSRNPSALLAQSEILMRRGRLSDANRLALRVAQSTMATNSDASCAWNLAGRALHLLSKDEHAFCCHQKALELATNDEERAEALWGAFVCAVDLEIDQAASFLEELAQLSPGSIDLELQVVDGKALLGQRSGDIREALAIVDSALLLTDYATDPSRTAGFIMTAAYLRCLCARYAEALTLLTRARELTSHLAIAHVEAYDQTIRVHALIGLRQYRAARQQIEKLRESASKIKDPWLETSLLIEEMRLDLSRTGQVLACKRARHCDDRQIPAATRGELMALEALADAVAGKHEQALTKASSARAITKGIEARFVSRYAQLIAGEMSLADAATLLSETIDHSMIDPALLALRASKMFTQHLAQSSDTRDLLIEVVVRARDQELGSMLGLGPVAPDGATAMLTSREREVLKLMSGGLSNRQIARELVIEESTVKAHVHHVLQKLGVRTRLEAVLAVRDEQL